jgi:hypothetical protein
MAKNRPPVKTPAHTRVINEVLKSFPWQVIGPSSKALYVEMRMQYRETSDKRTGNNGWISATLEDMKAFGWKSGTTLATALFELQAVGLIVCTRHGGVEYGSKVCSLYAFTDDWTNRDDSKAVSEEPPSHAFRKFDTLEKAQAALDSGVAELRLAATKRKRGNGAKKKTTLQKLDQWRRSTIQKLDQRAISLIQKLD